MLRKRRYLGSRGFSLPRQAPIVRYSTDAPSSEPCLAIRHAQAKFLVSLVLADVLAFVHAVPGCQTCHKETPSNTRNTENQRKMDLKRALETLNWLRRLDLNQRPLGYEPKGRARPQPRPLPHHTADMRQENTPN
jgi:hypothetical protein